MSYFKGSTTVQCCDHYSIESQLKSVNSENKFGGHSCFIVLRALALTMPVLTSNTAQLAYPPLSSWSGNRWWGTRRRHAIWGCTGHCTCLSSYLRWPDCEEGLKVSTHIVTNA